MTVILLILLSLTIQEFLTTSQIQICDSKNKTDCSEHMLIQLTIPNSNTTSTQQIQINSTTLNNQTIQLSTPITLTITKTPIYAYYALKYFQDYNSQPYELQIPAAVNPCDDDWTSNQPTCGFQYLNSNKIKDSQGFCCSCGSSNNIVQNDDLNRTKICQAASVKSMAFCLRYSPLWYSSYNISKFVIHYNITISIKYSNEEIEQYTLGSEIKNQSGQYSVAQIIQDYILLNQPPQLESLILMKPSVPTNHVRVQAGLAAYMVLPKQLLGQGECNKLGVSYSSFKNEINNCKKQLRSCLQNQLEDLYQNDISLINNNSQPMYLIQKYGQFKQINLNNEQFLQFDIDQLMYTTIKLQINTTGRISYFGNSQSNEQGQIDLAEIKNFSISLGSGLLYAQITNIGNIQSEFKSYLNCSVNIISINQTELLLEPLRSKIIKQDVNVSIDLKNSNICNFSLLNNEGSLLDWKIVYLKQQNDNTINTNENKQNNQNQSIINVEIKCESHCFEFLDISCYLQNNCSQQIITFFTVLSGILITLLFCCICVGYKKKMCCWSKDQQMSSLDSILYQQDNNQMNRKLEQSYYQNSQEQQSTILYRNVNKIMYLNLALGVDPISNYLQSDSSFEVLATYQNKELIKLSIKRKSYFVKIFKEIYGQEDSDRNIKKYLEVKKESIQLFNNFLTEFPLFSIF